MRIGERGRSKAGSQLRMINGLVVAAGDQMRVGGDLFDRVDWQDEQSEFLSAIVQLGDRQRLAETLDPWQNFG